MIDPPMKVVFVIDALVGGGAERVLSLITHELACRGLEITVLTKTSADHDAYSLHRGISRICLKGWQRKRYECFPLFAFRPVLILRRAIRQLKPDLVVSFMYKNNVVVLMSLLGTRYRVIVSDHNVIAPCFNTLKLKSLFFNILRRALYRFARAVLVLNSTMADQAARFVPRFKIHVVYNPIDIGLMTDTMSKPLHDFDKPHSKWLVGAGRLYHQKGFDVLIRAFAAVADVFSDWRLVIFGEGPLRAQLQRLTDRLRLSSRVTLPGYIQPLFPCLSRADIYAMSSRWEGMGMTLFEAMLGGTAVVTTDFSVLRDYITDDAICRIVPIDDVPAMSAALRELMSNSNLRKRMGAAGRAIAQRYSLAAAGDRWEQLLTRYARRSIRRSVS